MKPMKTHVFRRRRYRIRDVAQRKIRGLNGECDDPREPRPEIRLSRGQPPRTELITHLDEAMHACLWDLDNEIVAEIADSIGKFLWRRGYRRISNVAE